MPQFERSCNVMRCDRQLSDEEVIRAIRYNIAAEYEAAQLYEQVAESTDNKLVKKVLLDITDEERVHAGELLKLLITICPDEAKHYASGAKEVEEMMEEENKGE